jgi:hypothetical protein
MQLILPLCSWLRLLFCAELLLFLATAAAAFTSD